MENIIKIAKDFIEKINQEEPFHPDYKYAINDKPIEFYNYWYFDFLVIPTKVIAKDNLASFGGAPGFTISKLSRKPEIIAWWKKQELEERQRRIKKLDKIIIEFEEENWKPALIRKLTGIKPKEALSLKRKFQFLDLSNERNRFIAIEEIEKLIKEDDH